MADIFISVPDGSSVQVIVDGRSVAVPGADTDSDNCSYESKPWDMRACYDNSYIEEVSRRMPQVTAPTDLCACYDEPYVSSLCGRG